MIEYWDREIETMPQDKIKENQLTVTPKLNFIPIGTIPEIQGKAKRVVKDTE